MFTKSRLGLGILFILFLLSVIGFLYSADYSWIIYIAVLFTLLFVFQLFAYIKNSNLETSLKKNIYSLLVVLIFVVMSNILWVFVFPWFRYVATLFSLIFIYLLFTRLREGNEKGA